MEYCHIVIFISPISTGMLSYMLPGISYPIKASDDSWGLISQTCIDILPDSNGERKNIFDDVSGYLHTYLRHHEMIGSYISEYVPDICMDEDKRMQEPKNYLADANTDYTLK